MSEEKFNNEETSQINDLEEQKKESDAEKDRTNAEKGHDTVENNDKETDSGISSEEAEALSKGLEGLDFVSDDIPDIPDLEKMGETTEQGNDSFSSIDDLIANVKEASGFNFETPSSSNKPDVEAKPASFPPVNETTVTDPQNNYDDSRMDLLMDIPVRISVVLGRAHMTIGEVLSMEQGTVVELDKLVGEPVEIMANDRLILKGEVVVIDENFGIRVTELVNKSVKKAGI